MRNFIFKILVLFSLLFILHVQIAQAAIGTVSSSDRSSLVCHDATCTTPTPGTINWKPSSGIAVTADTITGLSGQIWGNELGWIDLNPTGQGVTFADPTTGLLTGKAWSQVSGWINFAPTGQQVTVDPSTGNFSGWAWTGGPYGGWIKFDCGGASTCVKINWNRIITPIKHSLPLDVCSNIEGIQLSIPVGNTIDNYGHCVPIVDACPNLLGTQESIPSGYILNEIEACIPTRVDYCQNIKGNQYFVPSGMLIDSMGNCVKYPLDVCPNDEGDQSSFSECSQVKYKKDVCPNFPGSQDPIPSGFMIVEGICYPQEYDLCLNIDEVQPTIPDGYIIDVEGDCTLKPQDLCENLGGEQVIVPKGYVQKKENCFFVPEVVNDFRTTSSDGIRVITLPFVPSVAWILTDNTLIKSSVKIIDKIFNSGLTTVPYHVDLVSFSLVILSVIILVIFVSILIKWIKHSLL